MRYVQRDELVPVEKTDCDQNLNEWKSFRSLEHATCFR